MRRMRRAYYDAFSRFYDRFVALHSRDTGGLARKFLADRLPVQEGGAVLDICTGTATLLSHLQAKVGGDGRVVGLDFSRGMPPTLFVKDSDSLAEQIQRAFPNAKVVKTLNTMTAALMIEPGRLAGGDHSVFLSGNDAQAKKTVSELLASLGWKDIIDLGDIGTARGAEMLLGAWLRLYGVLDTPLFNLKVVR